MCKGILPANDKAVLEKVMVGGKTSGWVSEYLDTYFQHAIQSDSKLTEKAFGKFLEDDEHTKMVLKDFEKNFSELYSLILKICDMIYE